MLVKKIIAGFAAAFGITAFAGQAEAVPVPAEIVLAIDASTSISNANYALQVGAYANVLGSALISTDSRLAIGVIQFGNNVITEFALTVIDSAATKASLVAAVSGMTRSPATTGNFTNIAGAIDTAAAMLGALSHADGNEIIDVSTDGEQTVAGNPATSSNNAAAGGVEAINCLGIGGFADCSWNDGEGVDFTAASFADFERILRTKIAQETGVPEPATLALVGLGLLGLGAATRRRKAA